MTQLLSGFGTGLRRPVTAALVAALAVAVVFAGVAWRYHAGLVADARDRTERLSFLLSEQAARTFEAVDITLRGLEPVLPGETPRDAADLDALLRRRVADLRFVQAIRVTDAEGTVVLSSDAAAIGGRDPGCLAALATPGAPSLAIGCSAGDLGSDGRAAIAVARRLGAEHGGGLIVADLDPGYFARFFADVDLGPHSVITLVETHGHVLLASTRPADGPTGPGRLLVPPTDRQRLGQLQQGAGGQIGATHAADGYPLSVHVGIDRGTLARRWWQVMAPGFVLSCGVGGLLIALALNVERHRAERARTAQRAAVAQKLEAMGQMTASVAHDFRNVLTAFQASLRLLGKRGGEPALLREAEATLARGNAMIDRLLAFSRRQEPRLEIHDVAAVLAELLPTLRHVAGLGTDLGCDTVEGPMFCRIDKVQFEAALMNLVVNARQAMPDGGRIAVRARRTPDTPDEIEVTVADTGRGIDPATLRRVFEPFFTTKAQTGTGLGLTQVQAMMEEAGGVVAIESTVGVGTTVALRLPGQRVAAPPASASAVLDPV